MDSRQFLSQTEDGRELLRKIDAADDMAQLEKALQWVYDTGSSRLGELSPRIKGAAIECCFLRLDYIEKIKGGVNG